jgi:DnaK suppressor protein
MDKDEKNLSLNLLRSRLESERKRITEGKREEEATESFELERRLTLEKRLIDQLADVEHALKKFEDGTYGLCDNCGQPIDPARLEALPQASLCLNCKARQAKDAKGK